MSYQAQEPTQAPAPQHAGQSGAPADAGAPPPSGQRKEGWWLLIIGVGCLVLFGLAVLVALAAGLALFGWRSAAVSSRAMAVRATPSPGVTLAPALPYAGNVHAWTLAGVPAEGHEAFALVLETFVFTSFGQRAEKDLGEINRFKADLSAVDSSTSGKATVELSCDDGRKVTLEISFTQDDAGQWQFTLDKYTGPTP